MAATNGGPPRAAVRVVPHATAVASDAAESSGVPAGDSHHPAPPKPLRSPPLTPRPPLRRQGRQGRGGGDAKALLRQRWRPRAGDRHVGHRNRRGQVADAVEAEAPAPFPTRAH